jgi:hypothetical protein
MENEDMDRIQQAVSLERFRIRAFQVIELLLFGTLESAFHTWTKPRFAGQKIQLPAAQMIDPCCPAGQCWTSCSFDKVLLLTIRRHVLAGTIVYPRCVRLKISATQMACCGFLGMTASDLRVRRCL